LYIWIFIHWC